jgi:hypothetical protein
MNHAATDMLSGFHGGYDFCAVTGVVLYVYMDTNISENAPPLYSGWEVTNGKPYFEVNSIYC